MTNRLIAVQTDEGREVHARCNRAGYATLCGLSTNDDEEVGREVPLEKFEKIDCRACIDTIRDAKQYRENDFIPALRKT